MSTLSLRLPHSLHRHLRDEARREGVSINQLITTAVAEKLAALMTVDYLEQRASRGARDRYLEVLSRVQDEPPAPDDMRPQPPE